MPEFREQPLIPKTPEIAGSQAETPEFLDLPQGKSEQTKPGDVVPIAEAKRLESKVKPPAKAKESRHELQPIEGLGWVNASLSRGVANIPGEAFRAVQGLDEALENHKKAL